jgi:hypothetical protein
MYIYQIIHQVYEKFRGLPMRLAERFNKSPEWFRSHGYPPPTLDASGNGSTCKEVDDYVRKVEDFEACAPGAGLLLNELVYNENRRRLRGLDEGFCSQRELRLTGLKEVSEGLSTLDKCDFKDASRNDLEEMNLQLADISAWLEKCYDRIGYELDKRECSEQNGFLPTKTARASNSKLI